MATQRTEEDEIRSIIWKIGSVVGFLLLLIIGWSLRPVAQVEPGYVGVMTDFGSVEDQLGK